MEWQERVLHQRIPTIRQWMRKLDGFSLAQHKVLKKPGKTMACKPPPSIDPAVRDPQICSPQHLENLIHRRGRETEPNKNDHRSQRVNNEDQSHPTSLYKIFQ